MESYSSRAIILGVSVLITVAIASAIFIVLGYVLDIYKNVAKIDYASLMKFNELDKYDVSVFKNGDFPNKILNENNKEIDNYSLTGFQLYNFLSKIVSQHNMKYYNDEEKVTLEDCLSTWDNSKKVIVDADTYTLTVKCMTKNINFFDSETGKIIDSDFTSNYYCTIIKQDTNNDAILYFKKK